MDDQYSRSYATLGLQPGAPWDDIRHTYKALIKQWHPDHFQQNSQNLSNAEERTMEITRAYKTLADYYRLHGSTPVNPDSAARRPEAEAVPRYARESIRTGASTATSVGHSPTSNLTENIPWTALVILVAIVLLLYFWFANDPIEHGLDGDTPLSLGIPEAPSPEAIENAIQGHPADKYFTLGSKLGEVYAIQGIPSKTEDGVWHYGKSRIYFLQGAVARWDSHPDNPLNATLEIDPVAVHKPFIQRGSTKDEVKALQGSPWRQTEREWTYGSSRIFFKDNIVSGWQESSLNPLKIQR